jgi:OmcA/MtrC family decaheme c-type cytochrome
MKLRPTPLLPVLLFAGSALIAQEAPLAWDQVANYKYNLLGVNYEPGTRSVTVVFSVTNPNAGNAPYDILPPNAAVPFKAPATLRVDVSWNAGKWGATELVNTKDGPFAPVLRTITAGIVTGVAPASATAINAFTAAKRCSDAASPCLGVATPGLTFWVRAVLPVAATGAGRVGIEGHPSVQTGIDPVTLAPVYTSIPVTSVWADFAISTGATPRREVVTITKCKGCHDGRKHGDTVVPRLSLHGANRNEAPGLCVTCHNPDQTDAAYRTSGAEESVDFKRMIHGIHAGKIRRTPLVIIGRNGSVNNYSTVRFPAELRNCVLCHTDANGKGTFELPLATNLGSTIATGSLLTAAGGQIDIDPANNLRISPIAATCSACHNDSETRTHMRRMGASFGVVQTVLAGKEQCVKCHGPGREKDVRRVHQIGRSSSSSSEEDDH